MERTIVPKFLSLAEKGVTSGSLKQLLPDVAKSAFRSSRNHPFAAGQPRFSRKVYSPAAMASATTIDRRLPLRMFVNLPSIWQFGPVGLDAQLGRAAVVRRDQSECRQPE
jgi:hypothetical protein